MKIRQSLGKRLAGAKASWYERQQKQKQIRQVREEARFKGQLAGAKVAGYREGRRQGMQPSGVVRFAQWAGKQSRGSGLLSNFDSSFYGVPSSAPRRKSHKHRASHKRRSRGRGKGRTIVIHV